MCCQVFRLEFSPPTARIDQKNDLFQSSGFSPEWPSPPQRSRPKNTYCRKNTVFRAGAFN